FVGTLEPRKGIDTLIDAFVQLAPDYPYDLVLAGKPGWYWQPILERIERSGLGARIRRLDYVPDSDLPALYTAASVLALPSRYEGFGFPVLEAMACGTPVVCSNASSLPEVAGDAGLLVPPDDPSSLAEALALVLSNEPLAATVRAKGLLRAARFTWEKTARATLQVYAQTAVSARVPR
ncbi:MAG TPA: glycosyltransferase family 1 protein, partial [Ardenticatenaceae bacterium]|nr:glycosyltransferase family 1 protein [Ardenticatenaceae bacterium]